MIKGSQPDFSEVATYPAHTKVYWFLQVGFDEATMVTRRCAKSMGLYVPYHMIHRRKL